MGQVVAMELPLNDLVLKIRAHAHDAGRAETTCAKHQLQAGLKLLELRQRVEAGEAGEVDWWAWYETQFTGHIKSRKYAEKLMKWARSDDPEAAIDAENEAARERMAKVRSERSLQSEANDNQNTETDIVEKALRLVARMTTDERESFHATYMEQYQ